MKILKIKAFSALSIASLALLLSACGGAANTTANNSTLNTNSKSNTTVLTNSNQTTVNNTAPVSNTAQTPASESEADTVQGELQVGKTESVILYVGRETGDYAAYCFNNDSEAGRAILAACKNGDDCEVAGTIEDGNCKVPGLEADLSASGRISKVASVKTHGRKK